MKKIILLAILLALWSFPGTFLQAQSVAKFSGVTLVNVPLCASGCQNAGLYSTVSTYLCPANNALAWAIKGFSPPVNWNQVDCAGCTTSSTAPSYDWRNLDTYFNAWQTNCPGIILNPVVALGTEGGNNQSTPLYIFNATYATNVGALQQQDMVVSANYKGNAATTPFANANGATGCTTGCAYNLAGCVTGGCTFGGGDTTGMVVTLPGEPVTIGFKNFIHQWFLHFSSVSNCALGAGGTTLNDCSHVATIIPFIGYSRFGCVAGGECAVLGLNFWPVPTAFSSFELAFIGSSSVSTGQGTVFNGTCGLTGTGGVLSWVQDLITFLASEKATYSPSWGVMFDLHDNGSTPNHAYGGCEALYTSQNRLMGIGTNGLQQSDPLNFATNLQTQTNWAANFTLYRPSLASFELQQLGYSDPTSDGSGPCPTQSAGTGSALGWIPFGQQRGATILELYANEAGFAFISVWANVPASGNACSQTNWQSIWAQSTYNIYGAGAGVNNPYALAIQGFAQQAFLATGQGVGQGATVGTATMR